MASFGWRIIFIIGGVLGLAAAYVRHYVKETPVFLAMREQRKVASRVSLGTLLRESPVPLLAGLAVSFMAAAVPPVLLFYPAIYMRTVLHFDPLMVQNAQIISTITMAVGSMVGGWLTDVLGPIKTYVTFAIGLVIASYWFFLGIQNGPANLNLTFALVGFFGGISGLGYFFLVQAFAPQVRFTGVSIPYNISSAIGGALPIVVAALTTVNSLAPGHIIAALAFLAAIAAPILWRYRQPIAPVIDGLPAP